MKRCVEAGDVDQVFDRARTAYLALCGQPRSWRRSSLVRRFSRSRSPFAPHPPRSILRGTFDCLVRRRDGGVTVLELKTGKPAPEHDQQLEIYLTAARAMFPGTQVEGKLVYAGHPDLDDRPLHSKR